MDEISEEQKRAFLVELTALTRKHGIQIDGCGCCGSPALELAADAQDDRSGYAYVDRLRWIAASDEFEMEEYGAQIAK